MYRIIVTEYFKRQLKRLAKKDPVLRQELIECLKQFNKESSISIGKNVFKVRLQSSSKGKSGGYRLYLFIIEANSILSPIYIYAKNDVENLPLHELTMHLKQVKNELEKWL